ncbi:MAG: carboxyl transferase domain-containing protein [Eubacteriaceae bacterium]|nr:carboxyl transferase domain-containing protein [Eubacteriaceae bacterium]
MESARKRIEALVDYGSFVEIGESISARATDFYSADDAKDGDGIICGYGVIGGKLVYIFSQKDASMGGTLGEMHGKKIVNLYKLAMRAKAPIIGLLDCRGVRVEEGLDGLHAFSQIYRAQADAVGVIPQIIGVVGICGGGMSMVANMADFIFVEEEKGKLFVNSRKLFTGGQAFNQISYTDGIGNEERMISYIKKVVELFPSHSGELPEVVKCTDDLNRTIDPSKVHNTRDLLIEIADNNDFTEVKAEWGKDMIAGFMRLNGAVVGVFGNDGESDRMTAEGIEKASRLVTLCSNFNIPVLSITDTKGYEVTAETERSLSKAATGLIMALAKGDIPKINLITGEIYGSAYSLMNSKDLAGDIVFMWDTATVNLINPMEAASILWPGLSPVETEAKAREYKESHCSPAALAHHGYVDKIISPENTRKYIIGAFEAFANVY